MRVFSLRFRGADASSSGACRRGGRPALDPLLLSPRVSSFFLLFLVSAFRIIEMFLMGREARSEMEFRSATGEWCGHQRLDADLQIYMPFLTLAMDVSTLFVSFSAPTGSYFFAIDLFFSISLFWPLCGWFLGSPHRSDGLGLVACWFGFGVPLMVLWLLLSLSTWIRLCGIWDSALLVVADRKSEGLNLKVGLLGPISPFSVTGNSTGGCFFQAATATATLVVTSFWTSLESSTPALQLDIDKVPELRTLKSSSSAIRQLKEFFKNK